MQRTEYCHNHMKLPQITQISSYVYRCFPRTILNVKLFGCCRCYVEIIFGSKCFNYQVQREVIRIETNENSASSTPGEQKSSLSKWGQKYEKALTNSLFTGSKVNPCLQICIPNILFFKPRILNFEIFHIPFLLILRPVANLELQINCISSHDF